MSNEYYTEEFITMLPQIPYIGGDENHLTGSLVGSVHSLAFYFAMRKHGRNAEEAGKVLYEAGLARRASPQAEIPPFEWLSREQLMERRKKRAERSQERRYPGDYVYEFIYEESLIDYWRA